MIKTENGNIEIIGKCNEVCADLGVIFKTLIETIGEKRTKEMIKIAIDAVSEENKKVHFIKKKELKNKLKQDLPEELAKFLCSLL